LGDLNILNVETAGRVESSLILEQEAEKDGKTLYSMFVKIPVVFILTANLGVEFQVAEIPEALVTRLFAIEIPPYTPSEMDKIIEIRYKSNIRAKMKILYKFFYENYKNARISYVPRLIQLENLVRLSEIGIGYTIESFKNMLKENSITLSEDLIENLKLILEGEGEGNETK